jgi:hypothetical protein
MNSTRLAALPYSLLLGILGIVYLGGAGSAQRGTLETPNAPSCPLPLGKQVQAVKAFREMMPVFRHPRCFNCHGGFDITSDAHEGSDFARNTGLDPRSLLTARERQQLHDACGTCHSNIRGSMTRLDGTQLAGWLVAPLPMLWNGKSDDQLCLEMKKFEPTGDQFVDHIQNDHNEIQFIEAAFNGDRALGADGLREYGVVAQKPPGTQADLVAKARKWTGLLGAGYEASPECGCVLPKIKLGIHHTQVSEVPKGIPSREESEARFELELEPMGEKKPGMFAGQHVRIREIRLTVPEDCSGQASLRERWVLYAYVDTTSGQLKTWRSLFQDDPSGGIKCKHGPGRASWDVGKGHLSALAFGGLDIPADSGSSKTVEEEGLGERESLTITVLELPGTE